MNFIEIVETIDLVENKLTNLTPAKLKLVTAILSEGATEFDVVHHLDFIIEYVASQTEDNAQLIAEAIDCSMVLDIILESARKYPTNTEKFLESTISNVNDIDVNVEASEELTESQSVTLLSVVTNTLTDILGEATVEALPAEMVFDIVESTKDLEMGEEADKLELTELIEVISENLKEALADATIDYDSDDYEGETLSEFLNDYTDLEDLLEEMEQVTEEVLAESTDEAAKKLLLKAKEATAMLSGTITTEVDVEAIRESAKNEKKNLMVESVVDAQLATENVEILKQNLLKRITKKITYTAV
jgi:hypothetical protein